MKPTGGSGLDKFRSKRHLILVASKIAGGAVRITTSRQHGTSFACIPTKTITGRRTVLRFCSDQRPEKGFAALIDEDIALAHLSSGKIQRFRLVLATKPHDVFFLCHVPSQNTDNPWNASNLRACERQNRHGLRRPAVRPRVWTNTKSALRRPRRFPGAEVASAISR